jgi:DNA polymerase I-like protein with 3'-5' exonuclease and polymerase domains
MEMLETGRDVHKYVAAKIFGKHEDMVNKTERQLGKKSGHSANYGVGARTFAEACLTEMNIVLTIPEADRIIKGYYEVFPGITRRQKNIQNEIRRSRTLKTPIGREQTWYGRLDDKMFREAYAYAPQSTIPDITNHLMLFLRDTFEDLEFLIQVHDSLLMQVDEGREFEVIEASRDYKAWHPKIKLAGGELVIPIDAEIGQRWGGLENV